MIEFNQTRKIKTSRSATKSGPYAGTFDHCGSFALNNPFQPAPCTPCTEIDGEIQGRNPPRADLPKRFCFTLW